MTNKRFLIFFLLVIHAKLIASDKPYDETVSLGAACQAAWQLEANGKRNGAYPFDWLVTPFHGLVSFILQRGEGFLEKDKTSVVEVLQGNPSILHVVDLTYDIHSIHDFFEGMLNYDRVKSKYERRTLKFFKLLASDKKILFIRVQMSRQEAIYLDQLLHSNYPKLDYTLVAISDDPEAQIEWGMERIRNFYMEQLPGNWMGDGDKWREILSQFQVNVSERKNPDRVKW